MQCPEDLIDELLDETLSKQEKAAFEAHLSECLQCRDGLDAARRAREELAAGAPVSVAPAFRQRVNRRVRILGLVEASMGTARAVAALGVAVVAVAAALLVGRGSAGASETRLRDGAHGRGDDV